MTPEMSVVVPAYNAAATLAGQLAALARQEVPFEWEVLVCDNGSTDATARVARAWADRLPGLTVVNAARRRGPAAARNVGAAQARGRYLAFCDADDEVADGWLSALRAGLEQAPLVVGNVEPLDDGRGPTVSWLTRPPIMLPWWPQFPAGATNDMAVNAAVFAQVGGFDEELTTAEDVDLCWRVQLAGHALVVRPDAVVRIRRRAGLRSIYRQARAYGIGGQQLQRKHATSAACFWDDSRTAPPAGVTPRTGEIVSRTLRSVLRGHLGDAAWRWGESAGRRAASARRAPHSTGGQM